MRRATGRVLFWLCSLGFLHYINAFGAGLQCYICDGQSMTQTTDECWTNFNKSDRVHVTETIDQAQCLACYTEVVDQMINATTRTDRQLRRRCLYEIGDREFFDKMPNKTACGVFVPQEPFVTPQLSGAKFKQAERCYCMAHRCNTWMVTDRRNGTVQQEASAYAPKKPGGNGSVAGTGSGTDSTCRTSSASAVRFGQVGMGQLCSYWMFWTVVRLWYFVHSFFYIAVTS